MRQNNHSRIRITYSTTYLVNTNWIFAQDFETFQIHIYLGIALSHLAWAGFKIKVKWIAHSTVYFDQ